MDDEMKNESGDVSASRTHPAYPPSLPSSLGPSSIVRSSRKASSMPLFAVKKEKTAWDGDQQYEVLPTDSFVLHPEIKVGREGGRTGGRNIGPQCV